MAGTAQANGTRSSTGADTGGTPDARAVRRIRRRLIQWGREHYQHFSWRSESDPWLTLVAETFLQRTRAPQAEAVLAGFRARYPTAQSLAQASPADIPKLTARLGLHWRGPLLHQMAREVAVAGGSPPESLDDLVRLPGVGPYAAAAWLSLHRGKRAVIIDNNVARWLARLTGREYTAESRRARWVRELAEVLTPVRQFRDYNYAVLDFTMQVCRPARPLCAHCPLRPDCVIGQGVGAGSADVR